MKWIEPLKDRTGKKAGERLAASESDAQPLVSVGIARRVERELDAILRDEEQPRLFEPADM
jgi:hypothetical protein